MGSQRVLIHCCAPCLERGYHAVRCSDTHAMLNADFLHNLSDLTRPFLILRRVQGALWRASMSVTRSAVFDPVLGSLLHAPSRLAPASSSSSSSFAPPDGSRRGDFLTGKRDRGEMAAALRHLQRAPAASVLLPNPTLPTAWVWERRNVIGRQPRCESKPRMPGAWCRIACCGRVVGLQRGIITWQMTRCVDGGV